MGEKTYHMFPSFRKFEGMFSVMSLRNDGNMKVYSSVGRDIDNAGSEAERFVNNKVWEKQTENSEYASSEIIDKKAVANRGCFLSGLGVAHDRIVSVKSVHGDNIKIVSESDGGRFIENTDGLISIGHNGLFLSVTVADCIPVVIFEPKRKVMCLLHCGWKGLAKGIIYKAVSKIKDSYSGGTDIIPGLLHAGIGPGIGVCHFEVNKDFLPFFSDYQDAILRIDAGDIQKLNNEEMNMKAGFLNTGGACASGNERCFIDLKLIAKKQLQECRVNPEYIEINQDCTYCKSDIFFSFRRDKKRPVDAMMVVAGWKS